ncbi:GNAT family N-acetyltransferase [Luteibacter rhizovicinus]|nr:GNAT family N-acetyltransferase [Luteibacter rhizovicinus]
MSQSTDFRIETYVGAAMLNHLDRVAALRTAVFREWPYLYVGDDNYEREYLSHYAASPRSICVLARVGDEIVGASTGIPLRDDAASYHQPFERKGIPVDDVYYFGESVVLSEWRGRGIGHRFFDTREAHARAVGDFRWTAFCSVQRDENDPRRPSGYRGNGVFWTKRGYEPRTDMTCELTWPEIGSVEPVKHRLGVWMRKLVR